MAVRYAVSKTNKQAPQQEIQQIEDFSQVFDKAEFWLRTTDGGDCNTDCIDLEADPVRYFPKEDSKVVTWGILTILFRGQLM